MDTRSLPRRLAEFARDMALLPLAFAFITLCVGVAIVSVALLSNDTRER